MQANTQQKLVQIQSFVPPEAMLQGLISSLSYPCNCGGNES